MKESYKKAQALDCGRDEITLDELPAELRRTVEIELDRIEREKKAALILDKKKVTNFRRKTGFTFPVDDINWLAGQDLIDNFKEAVEKLLPGIGKDLITHLKELDFDIQLGEGAIASVEKEFAPKITEAKKAVTTLLSERHKKLKALRSPLGDLVNERTKARRELACKYKLKNFTGGWREFVARQFVKELRKQNIKKKK